MSVFIRPDHVTHISEMKRSILFFEFLICTFFINCYTQGTKPYLQFKPFQYTDQLPSNSVQCLYKDKEGYMWFGTRDGLCRFDGYRIWTFRSNIFDHKMLSNNNIHCLKEDNHHCLWIGTNEGLDILDKTNYSIEPFTIHEIGRDAITDLCRDRKGSMWVATSSKGIVRITPDRKYFLYNKENSRTSTNSSISIYQDHFGNIWTTSWYGGIAKYQPKTESFISYPRIGKLNNPFKILEDKDSCYWVCTWGDGIFAFNPQNKTHPYTPAVFLKNGKPITLNNIIYRMTQDSRTGYFWIISFSGLDVLEKINDTTFNVITSQSMFELPSNNLFHEIMDDGRGSLWLGAVAEGIYKLDFKRNDFQTNDLGTITRKFGFAPNIYHVCEAGDNNIYMVIDRLGVYCFNNTTGIVTQVSVPFFSGTENIQVMEHIKGQHAVWLSKEGGHEIYIVDDRTQGVQNNVKTLIVDPNNLSSINCLFEDSIGDVWIGYDQGLYKRSKTGKITLISRSIFNIISITSDKRGNLWVGTEKQGAFCLLMDSKKNIPTQIINFSERTGNLESNSIQAVCCDHRGNVYLGSREGSIYLYKNSRSGIVDISYKYGITEDAILDIIEDKYGMLWISTTKRIIRYNPQNNVSVYYTSADEILVSSFSKNGAIKLHDGKLLFGGNKGFCLFTPTSSDDQQKSNVEVKITNIDVNNRSIFGKLMPSYFDFKENVLTLNSSDNNINLEYSSLDFIAPDKIQYAYRLVGIDKDWVYQGSNRRYVNYANLPAGEYIFEVKATDETGQWSTRITTLRIIKRPPFYLTWWAYVLYLIAIGGVVWFGVNRIRLQNELKISRIEKEKSEELTQVKLRYFTSISHDLLTPLTVISLLITELEQKLSINELPVSKLIVSNVNRLKRLIHQILDFRKIESGNMKLRVREREVVAFVREVCYFNFQPLIDEKNIDFAIDSEFDNYSAWFDDDKLDKILYNLLSNAFKFTPDSGIIRVKLSVSRTDDTPFLKISVSDSGVGIREDELPHIFSRFYISNTSDQSESNGIGLSLVKELTEIHHGKISVSSTINVGSVFTLEIPVFKDAYLRDEIRETQPEGVDLNSDSDEIANPVLSESTSPKNEKYNLLIVEDNQELRQILVSYFSTLLNVFAAGNGIEALDVIKRQSIDVVITDVMMPQMDGLELCQHIKNDILTSHIVVLLLTAKINSDAQVDYFKAGADAYMPKPFEMKVLEARVENLIVRREKSIASFKESKEVEVSSMNYGSLDEEFLKSAIIVVEEHLEDIEFDFDAFAVDMGSSKSTLHRKLKSLTGLSPGEFIRSIRLKHACKMLIANNNPISEIAFSLGFNDPKYFSRSFKSEYNMSPSEYRNMYYTGKD